MKKFFARLFPGGSDRTSGTGVPGEHQAAIAFALYKYREEQRGAAAPAVLASRAASCGSQWNSKLFGMRRMPVKRSKNERV